MRHLTFTMTDKSSYPVCLLVQAIQGEGIRKTYIEPYGLDPEDVLVMDLHYNRTKKKTPKAEMQAYIEEELLPVFLDMKVEYVVVTDGDYFKALTGAVKTDMFLGYVLDCEFGPPGRIKVVYAPSYRTIFNDPQKITFKIAQGINALTDHRNGNYVVPGTGILRFQAYPKTHDEIEAALEYLLNRNQPLTIDIEGFSLKHHKAGIGTISFAWSKREGIAFPVDYAPNYACDAPFGMQLRNEPVRVLLRSFFERFTQKAVYHHIAYDAYVLIYQLYMKDILDTAGLLKGMDILLNNWDCTKLISYLATNSCAGNKLSLKDQAQEYAGNYAVGEDIRDITRIPLDKLLRYNLVDALSTWYVHEKHYDTMVADRQLDIYETLFKPATADIIQMQLTGLPVNMHRVREVKLLFEADRQKALRTIELSPLVQRFTHQLNEQWVKEKNETLKKKRVSLADAKEVFNPNSSQQLQELLYGMLGLPVIAYTDSRLPATGGKTLASLVNHANPGAMGDAIRDLLTALIDYKSVNKLLTDFIPSLEESAEGPDGWHYLFGHFNLGGTLSGRLSSSEPNLQNLPAGTEGETTIKGHYGKLIKTCIEAPPGWIFCGLDFNSLEDRISALTTKDPQKLKVYTDGYDSHSLRAYAYFTEQMPGIDPDSVESINSIQHKFKVLRQKSKTPTFALQYAGTYVTLMTNCGFSQAEAVRIETRYHELYKVSDAWVAAKLDQACKDGYITAAFGLRVRTPLLNQVIRGTGKTPHEAEAEGRSAGNALGQSWCLLNSRAGAEFMHRVRDSEYRLDIRPCAQIHDAQYYMLRDDAAVVSYTNRHLVAAVQWQDHPDIRHDTVKLGGQLSIFWPTWAYEISIPDGADKHDLAKIIETAVKDAT